MMNEFLTTTLQAIIVLDVIGLVTYFVLAARRSRRTQSQAENHARPPDHAVPRRASLWGKLTGQGEPTTAALASCRAEQGLDGALGQLRRVLDSYRSGLT